MTQVDIESDAARTQTSALGEAHGVATGRCRQRLPRRLLGRRSSPTPPSTSRRHWRLSPIPRGRYLSLTTSRA